MKTPALLLLFLAFVLFTNGAVAGITFEKTVVVSPCDAGQAVVTAAIPFKVEGDKPVSVTQIKTSCNCTTGEADAPEYAPDTTGKLNITFTVGERTGLQRKTITVKTSDGQEQVAFFQTTVPVILEITPAFVFWPKNAPAAPKEIQIKVALDKPVQVTGVKVSPDDTFTTELKPVEPGKRYILKITPKDTAQSATARIVLKTDFPKDTVERFVIVAAVK